jgi:cytochrome c biogenesis protein CcdA/thiol-disulfide isomerase/thioredoxin
MILLLGFALLAGFATCLTPCVLPVLPIVLSGAATGGRRRPLGIVTGLVLSFTFSVIALVYVIAALGLPNDIARTIAVVVLAAFGLSLLVPALSARFEAWLSRFGRVPADSGGGGFFSGLPLGFGLGFLYAPCAGPILAGVITVSAAQSFTAGRLAVAFAYALGSAAALYVLMLGGRRLVGPLLRRSLRVQQALGALMVVVAALVVTNVDVRFQTAIASKLPGFLTAPSQSLQSSGAIQGPLAAAHGAVPAREAGVGEAAAGKRLPTLGVAPELRDTQMWFNTPGGRPLSMQELQQQGKVVLIDFWTYTCINCIRTFPHLKALWAKYHRKGLEIVGVHSPEFPFEHDADNVAEAIQQNRLPYPVVQDNEFATWNAYGNAYWPADYLVDTNGFIRYVHFGEGDYEEGEQAVRSLLAEAGRARLGSMTRVRAERAARGVRTPESYLGAARAQGFVNGFRDDPITPGSHVYRPPGFRLPLNRLAYGGQWTITDGSATAGSGARLDLRFQARRVFLVMGSARDPEPVRVLLDGEPIPDHSAGADVRGGRAEVSEQRLYRLVELPRVERHLLTLRFAPGIAGYAFTFG